MRDLALIGLLLVLLCGAGCVYPGAAYYGEYEDGYSSPGYAAVPSYGGYGYGPGYGGYYASGRYRPGGGYCRD